MLCLAFFLFFESTYFATNHLTELHGTRLQLHSSLELAIPFVPSMALVYLSLNVMLALTPFMLRTWREIVPLCLVMTGETVICAVFFLLLPVDLGYAAHGDSGAWGRFCDGVSTVSLRYNNLPSLHVAFAFTAAMAFGARCGPTGRRLFLIWAGSIAASTLLIHEHHVVDVAAGIILALAMRGVYRRISAEPWLDALRLEILCLAEFRHFVLRHRRYLFTLIVIYKYSLGRWRQTRVVRAGYCLTQHVDDVLDGDRDVGRDPEEYVRALMWQMRNGDYDKSFVSSLASYVVTTLREYSKGADADLVSLFDLLLFDRRRLRERLLLTGEELREHHRRTFFYSLNLTLIACGAELRAPDAPELISALAWCSVMRDLREDYCKGLINIPAEVMAKAGDTADRAATIRESVELCQPTPLRSRLRMGLSNTPMEYAQLLRDPEVRNWIRAEYMRGCDSMERCAARLHGQQSRPGAAVLSLFLRAIRAYSRKYARQNREILSAATAASLREIHGDGAC